MQQRSSEFESWKGIIQLHSGPYKGPPLILSKSSDEEAFPFIHIITFRHLYLVFFWTLSLTDLHNGFRCGCSPLPGFHWSQVIYSLTKSHQHQNLNFAPVFKFSLQIWHIIYISDDVINYIDKIDFNMNVILVFELVPILTGCSNRRKETQ